MRPRGSPMAHSGSGRRRGLAENARAALLGGQVTTEPAAEGQAHCRRSGWPKPRRPPSGRSTPFIESYTPKYEQAALPKQRSGHAAGILRFPGLALETPADHQPHRKHVRHCASPHDPLKGLSVEPDRAHDGLQIARGRAEQLTSSRWPKPVAKTRSWCGHSTTGSRSSPSRPTVSP